MAYQRTVLEIPLFHSIYDLYKLLDRYHTSIPKNKRYTVWQKCQTTTLDILELLISASHHFGEERGVFLRSMSQKLDLLKVFVRLAKETRTIKEEQHAAITPFLQEIGRMIGGWLKSVSHPA